MNMENKFKNNEKILAALVYQTKIELKNMTDQINMLAQENEQFKNSEKNKKMEKDLVDLKNVLESKNINIQNL